MSSRTLYRLSGGAVIVGAILLAIGFITSYLLLQQGRGMYTHQLYVPAQMLQIYGAVAFLMGLSGIVARQAQAAKSARLGIIGCMMTFLGLTTLEVGMSAINAFLLPRLANRADVFPLVSSPAGASLIWYLIGLALQSFGPLLFGIAIVRARTFPRVAGVLLIIAPLLGVISFIDDPTVAAVTGIAFTVLFCGAFAWCGSSLLSQPKNVSGQIALQDDWKLLNAKEPVAANGRGH